jgi:diadenosine tetraphosphate (Ap4A) HIT family hydrolase
MSKSSTECLVCKIINKEPLGKEPPVPLIYEDSDTIAFPMWYPLTKGHVLVCPKKHFSDVFDADSNSLSETLRTTQKVALKLKSTLGVSAVNLINNSGKIAGQDVFHFHMHIIPRRKGDKLNLRGWWLQRAHSISTRQLSAIADQLKLS